MSNVAELAFVKSDSEGNVISLWAPQASGDYAKDSELGRNYASQIIKHMAATGAMPLLAWVIRGFGKDDDLAAIEIGFCQVLAEHAVLQATNATLTLGT